MKISKEQQKVLDKAIELLKKYDKENYSGRAYFFTTENGDDFDEDYDCCDKHNCIDASIRKLEEEGYKNPVYNLRDSDYDKIDYCYNCGNPLNASLTWIEAELAHHEKYHITKEYLKESFVAFAVKVIFEAMPTRDCGISEYTKAHPGKLKAALQRQSNFVDRVIKYAEKVIEVLQDIEY